MLRWVTGGERPHCDIATSRNAPVDCVGRGVVVVSSKTENFSCGSQAACARTATALLVTPSARPLLARAQLHGQQSRLSRRLAGWLTGLGQAAG